MILMHRCREKDRAAAAGAAIHPLCFPEKPWDEAAFSGLLNNEAATCYLTWEENEPVAMLLLHTTENEAEILTFCVRPSHQLQGFGEALMRFSEGDLKKSGTTRFFLDVNRSNEAARKLYTKLGYTEVYTRKNYYGPGADALVLEKILS